MRARWYFVAVSIIWSLCNCPSISAERYAVLPREDTTLPPKTSTSALNSKTTGQAPTSTPAFPSTSPPESSASVSDTAASSASVAGSSSPSSSTAQASDSSTAASSVIEVTASPIPKGTLNGTSNNDTVVEGLPLPPRITPGLSVAGAFMLLTGSFYTLVGIKTKWLHISLSSAYLVSLAVTVLIIYVMHPPISNALQGVYVTAVTISGLLLGGCSIIFKDVTEGFGCFIGGFCLSMWFMVLAPGGLISNQTGKIIFISILTVGAYALYVSHYTRPYGLIASTSFAGATVTVLGIDCFSRAGLKEFWVYIWSLNDILFPPHYHQKYPITRGIRVEIAAIVIITMMGIMSQMKVWKLVKQKREERAAENQKKEHARNLSDEERGKTVESSNAQDRPLWEALHGDQNKTNVQEGYLDSGLGTEEPSSTRQSSVGGPFMGSIDGGMELHDLPVSANGAHEAGRLTVHVGQDDFFCDVPITGGQRSSMEQSATGSKTSPLIPPVSSASSIKSAPKAVPKVINTDLTLQPRVVPPPFKIPDLDSASDDDGSSIEASAPTEHLPDRGSKRMSSSSFGGRLPKQSRSNYIASGTSEEALMIPHIEDDRASSMAATADGGSDDGNDHEALEYSRSPTPVIENILDERSREALEAASHDALDKRDQLLGAAGASSTYSDPELVALPGSRPGSIVDAPSAITEPNKDTKATSVVASEAPGQQIERVRLSGNLPQGGSKVVTAYRTNEWAKHLEVADAPVWDDLRADKKQIQAQQSKGEAAAPLDVRALQQTPLNAEPAPLVTKANATPKAGHESLPSSKPLSSNLMSRNPFSRHSKQQKQPPKSQPVLHPLTIAKNNERTPSQTSLVASRTSSQTSLNSNGDKQRQPPPKLRASQSSLPGANRGQRSSSALASPLAESPIEEGIESSFPHARFIPSDAHLMSQRDRVVNSKPSSTSLLRTSYSNAALDQHPAYRIIEEEDDEDIPLTQRKSMLQQNPQAMSIARRSSSGPMSGTATPAHRSGTTTPALRGSNPHRSSSTPQLSASRPAMPTQRDSTISAWRTSLKPDVSAHYENQAMDSRRADLLREKHRQSTSRLEGQLKEGAKTGAIDQRMRRGSMMNAHANAMRKLQGEAKV